MKVSIDIDRLSTNYMGVNCPLCRTPMRCTGRPIYEGCIELATEDSLEYHVKSWWTCPNCKPCAECGNPSAKTYCSDCDPDSYSIEDVF